MAIPDIQPYVMPRPEELPANTVTWTLDPRRAMLLIHDMQNYFLRAFPAGRSPVADLMGNVSRLRRHCTRLGIPVSYSAQPGGMTDERRGLLRDFWGPGMTTSPDDCALAEAIAPTIGDQVFVKWRYSAFHRSHLLDYLLDALPTAKAGGFQPPRAHLVWWVVVLLVGVQPSGHPCGCLSAPTGAHGSRGPAPPAQR
ncbi:hypothetical protein GCM10012275_16390 [Longimycelium tulufanense]|uniref:Isochorismatase-like domain-containing protein n=1 Tax=Longimycelium tulufanense TaxID=907463 RepID=A0A8J3C729_9PSEU|nr:isochorismatase family protein [Longimycelium tulufanense]GGM46111.1 hypothetical protein GCM10012275_16390 [Longimycelium tulufanense]